jgi:hypothetical protein
MQKYEKNCGLRFIKYQGFGLTHPFLMQSIKKLALFLQENCLSPLLSHVIQTSWCTTKIECSLGPKFSKKTSNWRNQLLFGAGLLVCGTFWQNKRFPSRSNDFQPTNILWKRSCFLSSRSQKFAYSIIADYIYKWKPCWIYCRLAAIASKLSLHKHSVIWPTQPRASESCWNIWCTILQSAFGIDNNRCLNNPIDLWAIDCMDWRWWHSESTQQLFEVKDDVTYYQSLRSTSLHHSKQQSQYLIPLGFSGAPYQMMQVQ